MKHRWLSIFLAFLLLISLLAAPSTVVFADDDVVEEDVEEPDEDPPAFTDIEGHWGRPYIERAVEMGLFSGTSETTFSPNAPMTRAMFVTVLAKLVGADGSEWHKDYMPYLFDDVKMGSYYEPYVAWAVHRGYTSGTQAHRFSPGSSVTREQIATFLASYLRIEDLHLISEGSYDTVFSDSGSIAAWAKDSVQYLAAAGIFQGSPDGSGGYRFTPKKAATRAECAVIFCQLIDNLLPANEARYEPTGISLLCSQLTLQVGDFTMLLAELSMEGSGNSTVIWYTTDTNVLEVSLTGEIVALAPGSTEVFAVSSNGLQASCPVTVEAPPSPPEPEPEPEPEENIASGNMSYSEKLMFVYGRTDISDPRKVYATEAEAKSHQVVIKVDVWDLNSAGEKYTRTFSFSVHENLAATVQRVFAEIYALPEKPVIHSLGGWRWRSYETSEHNMGMAIDVNPTENPYVKKGMDPYEAGFRPGENPYSIPIDGSIDKIFAKYGFTRGIYWNNGNKDYMHYSFFGT